MSSIPSTRNRFRAAITSGANLEVAAGLCEAVHKAELRELFEELEEASLGTAEEFETKLSHLKAEYCD